MMESKVPAMAKYTLNGKVYHAYNWPFFKKTALTCFAEVKPMKVIRMEIIPVVSENLPLRNRRRARMNNQPQPPEHEA